MHVFTAYRPSIHSCARPQQLLTDWQNMS